MLAKITPEFINHEICHKTVNLNSLGINHDHFSSASSPNFRLSGGSLGYWTACNNFKRYCTLPYCAKSPKWWVRVSVTTDGFCCECDMCYARWNPVSPLETKTYFYVYCYVVSQESYCFNGYSVRQHKPWETHSERIHVWNPERYYKWMQWCQRNIDLERWTLKSIE